MSRSTSEALLSERASPAPPAADAWKRNVAAVTAASFMGYTGFTLAMPFLPLYIGQLGVADLGQVAMWTGVSLAVTPGLTALLAPAWGRLGDRFGRKIMVERSLVSFVVIMAAMAYVTRAWQVLALRIVQGAFAGYGSLSLTMAAESAPRERLPAAIGQVQPALRLGPAIGPAIVRLFSGLAGLWLLYAASASVWARSVAAVLLGIGVGAAMTAAYSAAASVIPDGAHGAGFGVLTSASLVGMASSPFIAGFLSGTSVRIVFIVNVALMALLAVTVERTMVDTKIDQTAEVFRPVQEER